MMMSGSHVCPCWLSRVISSCVSGAGATSSPDLPERGSSALLWDQTRWHEPSCRVSVTCIHKHTQACMLVYTLNVEPGFFFDFGSFRNILAPAAVGRISPYRIKYNLPITITIPMGVYVCVWVGWICVHVCVCFFPFWYKIHFIPM